MRVFTELTPECDITAQMYASGLEKKEIASRKFRAISTIANQLQRAFEILHVRNGREMAVKLMERISGFKLALDFVIPARAFIASVLLFIFVVDFCLEQQQMRRGEGRVRAKTEYRIRGRRAND